jgi:catechol 2,3-dioxygenase-like lactoylglutathione lyase family enzyme
MTVETPVTVKLTRRSHAAPLLRTKALISGTLPSRDLAASRAFYEEALGLEVRQLSEDRLVVRQGYDHVYEVEKVDEAFEMPLLRHNGLNTRGDLVELHAKLLGGKDKYGIKKMTRPAMQHGTFGFYMQDRDGSWWEIQPSVDGPAENFMEDLSDRPDMTEEEARKRFQQEKDPLGDAYAAYAEAHKGDPDKPSILQTTCISHGTLESDGLQESRRFYEEVLGLQVKQLTPLSMMVGLATDHRYVVVAVPQNKANMEHCLRNRLLFESEADLHGARAALPALVGRTVSDVSEVVLGGDGRVGFELRDLDRNWWELYYDPDGAPGRYFD